MIHSLLLASAFLEPSAAGAPVEVKVNWARTVGRSRPTSYGLNLFRAMNPEETRSPSYQRALRTMNPGLVRIHSWEKMGDSKTTPRGWIDYKARRWDEEKILAALEPLAWLKAEVVVNVPSWPEWMGAHSQLPDPEVFAKWCADLARILGKSKLKVTDLEITNEKDMPFFTEHPAHRTDDKRDPNAPDLVPALSRLYRRAAAEVKKVNPKLRTGGPAAARPDVRDFARGFLKESGPNLDFYSVHAYASGSASDTTDHVFSRAEGMVKEVASLRDMVRSITKTKIPFSFNEYNISWTWETRDVRMTNHVSAAFDAIVALGSAQAGIESTAAWNEQDGVYGKVDPEGRLRPAAHLFAALNSRGIGRMASVATTSPSLKGWAVEGAKGRTLFLVNTSSQPLALSGLGARKASLISEKGFQESVPLPSLPPASVAWVAW